MPPGFLGNHAVVFRGKQPPKRPPQTVLRWPRLCEAAVLCGREQPLAALAWLPRDRSDECELGESGSDALISRSPTARNEIGKTTSTSALTTFSGLHVAPAGVLTIRMAGRWMSNAAFEDAISVPEVIPHLRAGGRLVFAFESNAGLPAGVGLRLLSLLNQLAALGLGQIELIFADRFGLYSYLCRNGFFDFLDERISSDPERPLVSQAEIYRGKAHSLVEIRELHPGSPDTPRGDPVQPLHDALKRHLPPGDNTEHLLSSVFTTLGELIDNVFNHSETRTSGFAILQAYGKSRPAVQIAVSDSGIGIPASIRRGLRGAAKNRDDPELIIEAFRGGLSRHGDTGGRGCGLPKCAELAAKYGSTVWVRTRGADVALRRQAVRSENLEAQITIPEGLLDGTHICLEFPIEKLVLTI